MPIGSETIVGEDAIIAVLAPLAAGAPGSFGLKDDCAVLRPSPGTDLVLKTDPIAAGVHFLPDDTPEDIGWKALAVNVSDLAAKAAKPLGYLMALSFPEAPQRAWLERFVHGLQAAQDRFGCHLLGGDTDRRPGPLTVSITVFGEVPHGAMVRRGTARPGDAIFVSGSIGDATLGLDLCESPSLADAWGLDAADAAWLRARYRRPEPRLGLASALRAHASAAMDLSDGLAKDLGRLVEASGVSAEIYMLDVPISAAAGKVVANDPERLKALLAGGDDYEILATVPEVSAGPFATEAQKAGVPVTRIGRIGRSQTEIVTVLAADGSKVHLQSKGWDHF